MAWPDDPGPELTAADIRYRKVKGPALYRCCVCGKTSQHWSVLNGCRNCVVPKSYRKKPKKWGRYMKKPTYEVKKGALCSPSIDPEMREKFPTLVEHLGDEAWEDGSTRETSTITIFLENGMVKMALNDRDGQRSLYITCSRWKDAMNALEKAAAAPSADWRGWKQGGKRK